MRYYLDTEFNGFNGKLISLALVREDIKSLYAILPYHQHRIDPWVKQHVIPFLESVPPKIKIEKPPFDQSLALLIQRFLDGDKDPVVVTDWPDDISYFCKALITKPGHMISVPGLKFEMHRVDAYPTRVADAVQHNAWWDAVALRQKLIELEKEAA